MSADPDEFAEAASEFASRRVISREEADGLENYAKRRAWWISGVAQMDIANDAHQSILDAIKNGTTFEDWKKAIGPKLEQAWGRKDSQRILLVFRNATTQAYNAGRWEQMNQPHVKAMRPYVEYDVVDDQRTSAICKPLRGVVLPVDDPFVLTHNPPLHHLCRSGLVSTRRAVAERKGITTERPKVDVTPGFGFPPHLTPPVLPSQRVKPPDPDIQLAAAVKAGKDARQRKPVKLKQPDKLSPEHWETHYRGEYGDLAKQVGYGRMLHERAKAMDWNEAAAGVKEFHDAGVPGFGVDTFRAVDKAARYGLKSLPSTDVQMAESARLMLVHSRLIRAKRVERAAFRAVEADQKKLDAANEWYHRFLAQDVDLPEVRWEALTDPTRRSHVYTDTRVASMELKAPVGTWVHEWGHVIEYNNVSVRRRINEFRRIREAGSPIERLADLKPGSSFRADEVTRKDRYWDIYVGKDYGSDDSEFLSTLCGDIANGLGPDILVRDPESFYFGLGLLAGI